MFYYIYFDIFYENLHKDDFFWVNLLVLFWFQKSAELNSPFVFSFLYFGGELRDFAKEVPKCFVCQKPGKVESLHGLNQGLVVCANIGTYSRFLIRSRGSLSLVIPNNKMTEHWRLKVLFITMFTYNMINLDEFDVYVWIKDIAGRYTIKKKKSSLEESFFKLNQCQPALQPTPGASSQK